jgi:predicted alpha/beta-hydrolase family hydrolase
MPAPEAFTDSVAQPSVRGFLHRPETPNNSGLVLFHGAGANCNAPLLVEVAEAFAGAGFAVLRCDLPFRQDKPSGPPLGTAELDQAGIRNAVFAMRKFATGRVFLGGHSYGGRQSTMLCANEPELVDGLLLLSYPLHPPRKPTQLRTQHLPNLRMKSLFIHGTRDPFGAIEEMEEALKLVPSPTKLIAVEGAGHDLGVKGRARTEKLSSVLLQDFQGFFPAAKG